MKFKKIKIKVWATHSYFYKNKMKNVDLMDIFVIFFII